MDAPIRDATMSPTTQADPALVTADPDMQASFSTPVVLNRSPIDVDATEADSEFPNPETLSDDVQVKADDSVEGEENGNDGNDEQDVTSAADDVEDLNSADGLDNNASGKVESEEDEKHNETIDLTFSPMRQSQSATGEEDDDMSVGIDVDMVVDDPDGDVDEEESHKEEQADDLDDPELLDASQSQVPLLSELTQQPHKKAEDQIEQVTRHGSSSELEHSNDQLNNSLHSADHQGEETAESERAQSPPPLAAIVGSGENRSDEGERSSSSFEVTFIAQARDNSETGLEVQKQTKIQKSPEPQNDMESISQPGQLKVNEVNPEPVNPIPSDEGEDENAKSQSKPVATLESICSTPAASIEEAEQTEGDHVPGVEMVVPVQNEQDASKIADESETISKPNQVEMGNQCDKDLETKISDDNEADISLTEGTKDTAEGVSDSQPKTDDDAVITDDNENIRQDDENDYNLNLETKVDATAMETDSLTPSNDNKKNQTIFSSTEKAADELNVENIEARSSPKPGLDVDEVSEVTEKKPASENTTAPLESNPDESTVAEIPESALSSGTLANAHSNEATLVEKPVSSATDVSLATSEPDDATATDEAVEDVVDEESVEQDVVMKVEGDDQTGTLKVESERASEDAEMKTSPVNEESHKQKTKAVENASILNEPNFADQQSPVNAFINVAERKPVPTTESETNGEGQDINEKQDEQDGDDLDIDMVAEEGEIIEGSEVNTESKLTASTPAGSSVHVKDTNADMSSPKLNNSTDVDMKDVTDDNAQTSEDSGTKVFSSDTDKLDGKSAIDSKAVEKKSKITATKSESLSKSSETLHATTSLEANKGVKADKKEDTATSPRNETAASKQAGTNSVSDPKADGTVEPLLKGVLSKTDLKKATSKPTRRVTFSDKAEEFVLPTDAVALPPPSSVSTGGSLSSSILSSKTGMSASAEQSSKAIASSNNTKDQIVTDSKTPEGHRAVEVINVTCSVKTQKSSTPKKRSSSFRVRLIIHNGTAEFELLNGNSPDSGLWTVLNPSQGGPINVRKVRKPPYVMSVVVFDNINDKLVENTRLYIHLQRASYEKLFPLCEYYLMKLPATRPRPPTSGPYRSAITSFAMDVDSKDGTHNSEGAARDKMRTKRNEGHSSLTAPDGGQGQKATGLKRHADGGFTRSASEQAYMKKAKMDSIVSLEEKKRMNAQILSDKKKQLLAKMGKSPSGERTGSSTSTPSATSIAPPTARQPALNAPSNVSGDSAPKHATPSSSTRPSAANTSTITPMNNSGAVGSTPGTNTKPRWGGSRVQTSGIGAASSGGAGGTFGNGGSVVRTASFKPTSRSMVQSTFSKGSANDGGNQRRVGSGMLKTIKMKPPPGVSNANDLLKDDIPMASVVDTEEKVKQEVEKRLKKLKVEWDETATKKVEMAKKSLMESIDKDLDKIMKWSIANVLQKNDIQIQ